MRTKLISTALLPLIAVSFIGCTTTATPTASTSTKPVYTTEKKVYSKEELDKRGRQTPAEALAAEDPSITVQQGRGR
jgi:hypothetical protein